jgi:integrase/recombinase XerD
MSPDAVTPLRYRMIEDMNARKLCAGTQRGHIHSCKRFAAFLNRSLDTATTEDIRRFQLHLAEAGVSICNRNRIMTGCGSCSASHCGDWIWRARSTTSGSPRRYRW